MYQYMCLHPYVRIYLCIYIYIYIFIYTYTTRAATHMLQHTRCNKYYITSQHTATLCSTPAMHCNTMQRTIYYNTLQHTKHHICNAATRKPSATHTLQHTPYNVRTAIKYNTHCNTPATRQQCI